MLKKWVERKMSSNILNIKSTRYRPNCLKFLAVFVPVWGYRKKQWYLVVKWIVRKLFSFSLYKSLKKNMIVQIHWDFNMSIQYTISICFTNMTIIHFVTNNHENILISSFKKKKEIRFLLNFSLISVSVPLAYQ